MLECNRYNCWAWANGICLENISEPVKNCPCFHDKADILPRPTCNLQVGDKAIIMMPGPYYREIGTVVRKQLLELNDRAYQIYYIKTADGTIQDFFDDEVDPYPYKEGVQYAS